MVNIALIGYGYWGKRFLRYIDEEFNVKYIFGRSLAPGGRFINDLNIIWEDDSVTSVVIATPIDTHYEIVREAILHNKHVLCEKPLSRSSKQVLELLGLASDRGLRLVTEFTYTFSRTLRKAQQLVKDGCIGDLEAVELSLKYLAVGDIAKNDKYTKFSINWLLASHLLAVLDMFTPLGGLQFSKIRLMKETSILPFYGGARGFIYISFNHPNREARVVIYGSNGTILCDLLQKPTLKVITYDRVDGGLTNATIVDEKEFIFDETNNLEQAICYFKEAITQNLTNLKYRDFWVTSILEGLDG